MKISLDIILHEDIQKLFDNFAACFDVSILFYSADGRIMKRGLNRSNCEYCQLVQDKLFDRQKCVSLDDEKCKQCTSQRSMVAYKCHAGLHEAVAPIFIENKLAGYTMLGQFRSSGRIPTAILKSAREKGLEKQIRAAYRKLPHYPQEKVSNMLGLFSMLINHITSMEIVGFRHNWLLGQSLAYIERNMANPIRLSELAEDIGRSCSCISHAFKQYMSKSFTEFVIEAKLSRAEEYFRLKPEWTIGRVATELGYSDPLYFSRLYKKYRHITPKQFQSRKDTA